jgi:hypothetical protein
LLTYGFRDLKKLKLRRYEVCAKFEVGGKVLCQKEGMVVEAGEIRQRGIYTNLARICAHIRNS